MNLNQFLDDLKAKAEKVAKSNPNAKPDPRIIIALVDVAKTAKREHEAFSYVISRLPEAHALMEQARKASIEKVLRESAGQPSIRIADYMEESEAQGGHSRKAHGEVQDAAREHALALDRLTKIAEAQP